MKVLVTGGAGYIGSATAKALESAGHVPIILDSLMSGPRAFVRNRTFYEGDIADRSLVGQIFQDHPEIHSTIHMASRIVVAESVDLPYEYYRDNVSKSLELFDQLASLGRPRVLFSSSASLYAAGEDEVSETSPLAPSSPYARTKWMTEQVLTDMAASGPLRAVVLRYFNPIGSDPDLESGEHVRDPTHVLGRLTMAAKGRGPAFAITGTDYSTRDGTGLRDYIHVWDLALAHVAAVERFDQVLDEVAAPSTVLNVGTGTGVTVRELITAFEKVLGHEMPVTEAPARRGDVRGAFANVDKARDVLGWSSTLALEDGIRSALGWSGKRRTVLGYE